MSEVIPELRTPRIGIDIGRVITSAATDVSYSLLDRDNFLDAPETPHAVETIGDFIVPEFGPENVYLVSKCGPSVQHRTSRWLEHIDFYKRTGVLPEHVFYCLERSEKAGIAGRLKLTHFIDDRINVFDGMAEQGVSVRMHFAPEQFDDKESLVRKTSKLYVVNGWPGTKLAIAENKAA